MIDRIEIDEVEGENVYSETWNPSPDQMRAYLAREVAMCKSNIAVAKKQNAESGNVDNARGDVITLHSWSTTFEAVTDIRVERKPMQQARQ